jgi:outer membrane protein assembly factor BamB
LSQAPRRVGCAGFLRARLPAFKTGNQIVSSPAVANGVVYATSTDDTVYALNATTGVELRNQHPNRRVAYRGEWPPLRHR